MLRRFVTACQLRFLRGKLARLEALSETFVSCVGSEDEAQQFLRFQAIDKALRVTRARIQALEASHG